MTTKTQNWRYGQARPPNYGSLRAFYDGRMCWFGGRIDLTALEKFVKDHPEVDTQKQRSFEMAAKILSNDNEKKPKEFSLGSYLARNNESFQIDGEVVINFCDDLYDLWERVSKWEDWREQEAGYRSYGWFRHGVRLLARFQWFTISKGEVNWLAGAGLRPAKTLAGAGLRPAQTNILVGRGETPPPLDLAAGQVPPLKKYKPSVPDVDIQDNRMVCASRALKNYLRKHRDGDWVSNPHLKQARAESLSTTKARADDHIKKIITEWALSTREGERFLCAADLKPGEFTIDRIRSRNGDSGGLNCIWNLYFMPFRDNSVFGERDGEAKRAYVGETAWRVASEAHARFNRDNEKEYNWSSFEKEATQLML